MISSKTIGLALGGGFARAGAQVGALKVLNEYKFPIKGITGVSSGAIVAGAYAAGRLDRLEELLTTLSVSEYIKIFNFTPNIHALGTGETAEEYFREITDNKDLRDFQMWISIATADIVSGHLYPIRRGNAARAMRAACAVPGMLSPVKRGGRALVDAGILIDIDSNSLYKRNIDYVVGIKVSREKKWVTQRLGEVKKYYWKLRDIENQPRGKSILINRNSDTNLVTTTVKSINMILSMVASDNYKKDDVNFLVWPNTGFTGRYNVKAMKKFIKEGETEMLKRMPFLMENLNKIGIKI